MSLTHSHVRPASRTEIGIALALAVAVLLVFGRGLGNRFVNYDDDVYVTSNRHVQQGLTPATVRWALTTFDAANWHPLTWLSLELDSQLYGPERPWGYHLTSLLWHAANSVLLFYLFRRLTGMVWRSALVAGLFALHPLHVESVAWVAERKDVLSTFFGLLAILAYAGYVARPGAARSLGVLAAYALSLAAKPMLVTLPFLLLLLDYWPLGRFPRQGKAGPDDRVRAEAPRADRPARSPAFLVVEKIPLLALAAGSSLVTLWAQRAGGATRALEGLPLPLRLANAVVAYAGYLAKAVWPVGLNPLYPHPLDRLPAWKIVGAGMFLAVVTVLGVWQRRRRPYLLVGWLWYLGTLVPVIGLVQVGTQAMADRYTYLPLVGIFVMGVWWLGDALARRAVAPAAVAAASCAVLGACATAAWLQVGYWHDSVALWRHTLAADADNPIAHYNLGLALEAGGKGDEAREQYRQAIRQNPRYVDAHTNLGIMLIKRGDVNGALEQLRASAALRPGRADLRTNLAQALLVAGRSREALAEAVEALHIDPKSALAHVLAGQVLTGTGNYAAGERHLRDALALQPDFADAHYWLGVSLQAQHRGDEALGHYAEALRLAPNSPQARNKLGMARAQRGDWRSAEENLALAVRLAPAEGVYRYNLAYVLAEEGKRADAAAQYQAAVGLDPRWPEQARKAAWSLATSPDARDRDPPLALQLARQAHEAATALGDADPAYLDTLGAAYAEAGRFPQATAVARQAAVLAASRRPAAARQIEERSRLYAAGKPYREPPGSNTP